MAGARLYPDSWSTPLSRWLERAFIPMAGARLYRRHSSVVSQAALECGEVSGRAGLQASV